MKREKKCDSKWPIESIKIRIKSAIYPLLKSLKKIEKRRKIAFALFVWNFLCLMNYWWNVLRNKSLSLVRSPFLFHLFIPFFVDDLDDFDHSRAIYVMKLSLVSEHSSLNMLRTKELLTHFNCVCAFNDPCWVNESNIMTLNPSQSKLQKFLSINCLLLISINPIISSNDMD